MIQESLQESKEELKRADHLLFVSLKYTRTVDVLKSIVERLVNAYNFSIEAFLLHLQKKKKLEIPKQCLLKAELLKNESADEEIKQALDFYFFLKKVEKAEFQKKQEYRRHVAMLVNIDKKPFELTIDSATEFFNKTQSFVKNVENTIKEVEED